eukprot:TRINITY_DN765_c0_g1_i2.p1 TRINITY_DN765_c0_g1~~TRINITY_DN765_c0_g1_i2.p1  ORF type:complete len:101 (+),score=3.69 TRINITY_DN765_c0_g1_i2:344-646(+)
MLEEKQTRMEIAHGQAKPFVCFKSSVRRQHLNGWWFERVIFWKDQLGQLSKFNQQYMVLYLAMILSSSITTVREAINDKMELQNVLGIRSCDDVWDRFFL